MCRLVTGGLLLTRETDETKQKPKAVLLSNSGIAVVTQSVHADEVSFE